MNRAPGTLQPPATWGSKAACRQEDPELFFPTGTTGPAVAQIATAKAVCRRCPAVGQCLQWALGERIDEGVWGGLDENERRSIRRRRTRNRSAAALEPQKPAHTLRSMYEEHAQIIADGHSRWTGSKPVTVNSRRYTPTQLAFVLANGREPNGRISPTCGHVGCITGHHLADKTLRDQRGRDCTQCSTRADYQAHVARRETPCEASRAANTAADRRLQNTGTTKVAA